MNAALLVNWNEVYLKSNIFGNEVLNALNLLRV